MFRVENRNGEKLDRTYRVRVTDTIYLAIRALPFARRRLLARKARQLLDSEIRRLTTLPLKPQLP